MRERQKICPCASIANDVVSCPAQETGTVAGAWQPRRGMTGKNACRTTQLKPSKQPGFHRAVPHLATVLYGAETTPAIRKSEERHPPSLRVREAVRPRLVRFSIEWMACQSGKSWSDSDGIDDFSKFVPCVSVLT
jgi:hypothetical protein